MRAEPIQEEQQIAEERIQAENPFEQQFLRKRLEEWPEVPAAVMVELGAPVRDVLEVMAQQHVDGVLVMQQGQLVGVCTAHDVILHLATGTVDLDHLQVDACMQSQPICLHPDDELAYVVNQMFVSGAPLIPFADANDHPIGLISMREVLGYLVSAFPQELMNLPPVPDQGFAPKPEGA
jgi:CBS domain-containing protein